MGESYERMADAVLRALVADGFEGISVRRVAALAGVSIGAVQHHFPTKDAMLGAAMDLAGDRFRARLVERISPDMPAAEQLAELAVALISADDRDISVTWLLRLARAAVDEPTAARHRADWLAIEDLVRRTIAVAAPALDDRAAAVELLALLDGLACSVAVEPDRVSGAYAESIARSHVARLLAQSRDSSSR